MRDTILFDLDGTLLPLDMNEFMDIYFGEMGKAFDDMIPSDRLVKNVWTGTKAMITNLEGKTNETVFMETFEQLIDEDISIYQDRFNRFYDEGFMQVRNAVKALPIVKDTIDLLKQKGYTLAIATNPIFPQKAVYHRIDWAGLNVNDFNYISSYEQNCFCKPNIEFFTEVLGALGKQPDQCIMVGNDVQEDMIASTIGVETYLITNHIINRNDNIECDHQGTYEDFYRFAVDLPKLD